MPCCSRRCCRSSSGSTCAITSWEATERDCCSTTVPGPAWPGWTCATTALAQQKSVGSVIVLALPFGCDPCCPGSDSRRDEPARSSSSLLSAKVSVCGWWADERDCLPGCDDGRSAAPLCGGEGEVWAAGFRLAGAGCASGEIDS